MVPRQIEDAARSIGLCNKVYGDTWIARPYEEIEVLEQEALAEYECMDEHSDDDDEDCDTWVDENDGND